MDEDYEDGRELDDILSELAEAAIEVFEEPKIDFEWDAAEADQQHFSDDLVDLYLREVRRVSKLTHGGTIELAKTIERGGQEAEAAKVQLIESNLRLVVSIAERYAAAARESWT